MVCYSSNSLACLEISFKVFPSFNAVRIVSPPLFTLHKEIFGPMISVIRISPILVSILCPSSKALQVEPHYPENNSPPGTGIALLIKTEILSKRKQSL